MTAKERRRAEHEIGILNGWRNRLGQIDREVDDLARQRRTLKYTIDRIVHPISLPKPEGEFDGYEAIQGARVYDPVFGSFSTPDAFAGTIHDPMSQKPYVWNRNNPTQYSNPSGFCAFLCGVLVDVGADVLLGAAVRIGLISATTGAAASASLKDNGGFLATALRKESVTGDKPASTPTGSRRAPAEAEGQNEPATINGREHSGHALARAQGRGTSTFSR